MLRNLRTVIYEPLNVEQVAIANRSIGYLTFYALDGATAQLRYSMLISLFTLVSSLVIL